MIILFRTSVTQKYTLVIFLQLTHDRPDLPGEGTLGNFVAVLSGHAKLGVQLGPGKVQVD